MSLILGQTSCDTTKEKTPDKVAIEILTEHRHLFSTLKGESLFIKSLDIIEHPLLYNTGDEFWDNDLYNALNYLAWQNIRQLAHAEYPKAQFILGLFYAGYDFELGAWFTAKNELGEYYNSNIDLEESTYWFDLAAQNGVGYSKNNLGCCFGDLDFAIKNPEETLKWCRAAVGISGGYAECIIGDYFRDGCHVCVGVSWDSIPNSYLYSFNNKIGFCKKYIYKTIIDQNLDSAMYYWSMAEDQGYIIASNRIHDYTPIDEEIEEVELYRGMGRPGRP